MQYQLRIYKMKPGALEDFIPKMREVILPVRLKQGFRLVHTWVNKEANEYIWMLSHDHPDGFAAAEKAYNESPERKAIDWPGHIWIENMELRILDDIDVFSYPDERSKD